MAALLLLFSPGASAATFVVNSTSDRVDVNPGDGVCATSAGTCTLRAAIQEANALAGADTIHVPAGTYRLAIAQPAEPVVELPDPPELEEPLVTCTAEGMGDELGDLDIGCPLTIIGAGAASTIIDGGTPPFGAPIEQTALDRIFEIHPTAGAVNISELTVQGGWSSDEGGAIWNASSGKVRLTEVNVLNSFATGYGGGIYNSGDMVIERSTLSGNTTGGKGGGIFTDMGTLTVLGSVAAPVAFTNNTAAQGGGLYNGGMLSLTGLPARVIITHATFSGNKADTGGGVFSDQQGELTISDATFLTNYAGDYGGGLAAVQKNIVTLTRVTFSGNSASGEGGGARTDTERSVVIADSVFSGNAAGVPFVEEDGTVEIADAGGGGLWAAGSGSIHITRSTFSSNTATEEGGGIYIDNNGSVEISDSVVRDNSAHAGGGIENAGMHVAFTRLAIFGNEAIEDGGGIESQGSGDFVIDECSIFENVAENGGGLANAADGRLLVHMSSVYHNHARGGSNDDTGLGGGIYVLGDAAIHIENSTISGNFAKVRGGGLYVDADAKTRVVHCTITRNAAPVASGIGDEGTNFNFPPMPSTAVVFRNTIVAGNRLSPPCNYALGSEGGNIEDGNSCFFQGPRDRTNAVNIGLDAIGPNGGPTLTHALREGSVAIDAGVSPAPLTDQRGIARPQNGLPDSGAFEYEGPFPPPDTTPPDTAFVSTQMDDEAMRSFRFDGSDNMTAASDLLFECRLIEHDPLQPPEPVDPTAPPDPALAFVGCSNPWVIKDPEDGQFTLEVRAIDRAGNVDPTPAVHFLNLVVDVTPPDTFFTSTPSNPSTSRFGIFTFAGTDDATPGQFLEFECRIDTNDPEVWLECTNPAVFSDLTVGQHTVEVRAADLGDNVDPTPARFTWTVVAPVDCDAANVTLTADMDGWVDQVIPFENLVTVPELTVRSADLAGNARALVRFPLTNDAPNCVLESATLRLYAGSSTPGRTLLAIPIAGSWADNQVTWNNQPATTGTAATTTSGDAYREWDVKAHVEAIFGGSLPNHGWLIRDAVEDDPEGAEQGFLSRETPQDPPPVTLPQLVLRYASTGPTPIPTPQSSPVAAFVFCGQVITESTLVMNDLLDCLGEGLVIGAPDIILDLNGHTIQSGLVVTPGEEDGLIAGIRNAGHSNVTIRNGTVKNFGYGVRILGGARFNVIEEMVLDHNILAGVELFDADDGRNGNTIRNNYFTLNGEHAVALVAGSENSVVINNVFEGNGGPAVLIQDARGHRVESNFMSGLSLDPLIGSDAGVYIEGGTDNIILNNTVVETGDAGIFLGAGSHRNRIEGNVISGTSDGGVVVQDSDFISAINNVAHLVGDAGVVLSNSHHGLITGNDVRFNPGGITLGGGSSGNRVENNNVSYSTAEGIIVEGGLGNEIVNNTASSTRGLGIVVEAEAFDALGNPIPGNLIQGNTANQNLQSGISVSSGGHTVTANAAHNNAGHGIIAGEGVIDGGGNTASGNAEPEQCVGVVCTTGGSVALIPPDTTAPETTITMAPPDPSDFLSVRFEFTGTDNFAPPTALRFMCRMDPRPFTPPPPEVPDPPDPGQEPDPVEPVDPTDPESWEECSSPMIFTFLEIGEHTFQVRAVDPADNTDFTHASYTWTVLNLSSTPGSDTLPPQTTIVEGPSNPTTSNTATFTFRGSDNETPGLSLTFECRLDSSDPADFADCTSPVTYASIGGGTHTFQVRAVDAAGNRDPTPATHTWSREGSADPQDGDLTPPQTTILSGPHVATVLTTATFTFTSNEADSTFECKLDKAAYAPCTSPFTYTGLKVGSHTFRVRATDPSGNTDSSPAERKWTIGAPPVPTTVSCGQVLTRSTLVMNSLLDCPDDGLVIGNDRITVDLNGHFIDGTGLGAGIRNSGFDAVTIQNGLVQEFDYGVELRSGTEFNLISSVTASLNALAGIHLSNADDNIIRESTFNGNGAGIELVNGTQRAQVTDNSVGASQGDGIRIINSSQNRFQGTLVVGSGGSGFWLEGAGGNTIINSTVTGNGGEAIALTLQSNGNRVEGNTLSDSSYGVYVLESNQNEVIGNSALWMGGSGMMLENAHNNVVRANDVRLNSAGLELKTATGNRLEANNASQTSGTGISLQDLSLNNDLVLNIASFNSAGIYIGDLAPAGSGNLIDRNTASHNSGIGIYVANVGHIIIGNIAEDNGSWGIYAAPGTVSGVNVDGGGNRAKDNVGGSVDPITLLPLQCYNVVCDGGAPLPTDTMPPETTITEGPPASTFFTSATFHFTGRDQQTRVHFQCRLDSTDEADFAACTSPVAYTDLSLGTHTFQVRAVDFSSNADPTPATHTWTIEGLPVGVPPVTTLESGPDLLTVDTSATFTFSANEPGATFECSLDGAAFSACVSPATYTELAVGEHEFRVRAVDIEGLADATPPSHTWEIGQPAVPTEVSCGQVLTQSTLVLNDLVDCLTDGLVIGASGITVDLNGHTLDGTGLGSGILNNGFDSVTITNGILQDFDFGVQLNAGTRLNIVTGLTLTLNQEAAIQLSGADANTIRNNNVTGNSTGIALIEGTQNTLVQSNTLSGNPGDALYLLNAGANRLEANVITGSSGSGVLLEGSSGNTVSNNSFSANSGEGISVGDTLLPSNNNRIERNTLTGNSGGGITVVESSGNEVIENRVELNAGGISLETAQDTLVRGNSLRGNSGGIELSESSGNRIEFNSSSGNSGTGITLEGLSFSNVVLLNAASDNNGDGISAGDVAPAGQGNLIERNTASNNGGDGIFAAAGHTLTANIANFNDGWGIFAEPGVIDGGGNLAAGNAEPLQCSGIACADGGIVPLGAPDTLIVDRPPNPSNSRNALFTFTGTDDTTALFDLGFECRLDTTDELAWLGCDNPTFYTALSPGEHTFQVRAVDLGGMVDPTPASYTWTYVPLPSGVPPDTVIDLAPPLTTPLLEGFFTYSASEPDVTFECSLDGAAFAPCNFETEFPVSSGGFEFAFEEFQVGPHTFQVRAIDFEGNADPTPATHTWTVLGLVTTITSGPAFEPPEQPGDPASGGETESTSATFEFSANIADATFLCSLDLGLFTDCVSPVSYTGLAVGGHSFRVFATDPEGERVQLDPTEYEWTVILPPDTSAPNTIITGAPASNSSATVFTFTGTDDFTPVPLLTFECRLDSTNELDWFGCLSPFNLLDVFADTLLPGTHTFEVRAIDDADPEGNIDPTPASHTWTLAADTTPPTTSILSGPPAVTIDIDVVFTFAGSDNATPELLLTFECSLDGGLFEPCASPESVQGLLPGTHEFQVRTVDLALNADPTPASHAWTVVGAPETTITSGPPLLSTESTATFTFASDQAGSTFLCSLDGLDFVPCTSPATYTLLLNGAHAFEVQAVNSFGLPDVTPAVHEWAIDAPVETDTTPPETTITSGPAAISAEPLATFTFTASEPATFECSLDGAPFGSCASPQEVSGLADGSHTFAVRAMDQAGNVDPTPVAYTWSVDLPPEVTILSGPLEETESTSATFGFSSSEPGSTFECSLDGAIAACTSPVTYTALPLGEHVFAVRARDSGGNFSLWEDHDWIILAPAPPDTTITGGPAAISSTSLATFSFTGTDALTEPDLLTFECSLDGAPFTACTTPVEHTQLAGGEHTFRVRAIDEGGRVDPTPATYTWEVDLAPVPAVVGCGAVIVGSVLVMNDLVDCPGDALIIGADGIALDLNGHTIDGMGAGTGIRNDGFASVTITNGAATGATVQGFEIGLLLNSETHSNVVSSLRVQLNTTGILLWDADNGTTGNTVRNNTVLGNGVGIMLASGTQGSLVIGNTVETSLQQGIVLESSSGNRLEANSVVSSSGEGITLEAGAQTNVLVSNTSSGNGGHGIWVTGLGNLLEGNTANQNAGDGIHVAAGGHTLTANSANQNLVWGINAAPGNIDGGGNSASENGSPGQCSGVACNTAPPVDTIPPETTIHSGPPASTTSTSATFTFSSSEAGSTFECSLDGAAFGSCASPASYSGLSDGSHQLAVRAVDPAGNVDPTPASYSWTIAAPLPPTTLNAVADAWIDQNSSTSNKGDDSILKVQTKSSNNFRALVRFDLPAIPEGHVVGSASLQLYAASYKTGRTLQALRVAGPWSESGVTWANQPPTTGTAATTSSGQGWRLWDVTSQVTGMYQTGAHHGFLIRDAVENADAEQQFHSREKGETPPVLIINFVPSGG